MTKSKLLLSIFRFQQDKMDNRIDSAIFPIYRKPIPTKKTYKKINRIHMSRTQRTISKRTCSLIKIFTRSSFQSAEKVSTYMWTYFIYRRNNSPRTKEKEQLIYYALLCTVGDHVISLNCTYMCALYHLLYGYPYRMNETRRMNRPTAPSDGGFYKPNTRKLCVFYSF